MIRLGKGRRTCTGAFEDSALVTMIDELAYAQLKAALAQNEGAAPTAGRSATLYELGYSQWLLATNIGVRNFAALRKVVTTYLEYHAAQKTEASHDADAKAMAAGQLSLANAAKKAQGGGGGGKPALAATSTGAEGDLARGSPKPSARLSA